MICANPVKTVGKEFTHLHTKSNHQQVLVLSCFVVVVAVVFFSLNSKKGIRDKLVLRVGCLNSTLWLKSLITYSKISLVVSARFSFLLTCKWKENLMWLAKDTEGQWIFFVCVITIKKMHLIWVSKYLARKCSLGTLLLQLLLEKGPPFYVVIRATRRSSRLQSKGIIFISQLL